MTQTEFIQQYVLAKLSKVVVTGLTKSISQQTKEFYEEGVKAWDQLSFCLKYDENKSQVNETPSADNGPVEDRIRLHQSLNKHKNF